MSQPLLTLLQKKYKNEPLSFTELEELTFLLKKEKVDNIQRLAIARYTKLKKRNG